MKTLIIGGTLFIGKHMVKELLRAGHQVSVLHRKPSHDFGKRVENLVADRNDAQSVREALRGKRFEVVIDNVYDWSRGTTALQVEATLRACGDHLHRYVFMSSVAAYGDGLNHHEGNALAPDDHPDPYVRNKAASERALFRLHQRCGAPVVTLRPPYIYGPGNPFYREAFFWDRIRAGRPIVVPGDGRRLMQFAYVRDLVWACLQAIEKPAAVGHAFNIANPRPLTQTEVVLALAEPTGKKPTLVRVPRDAILRAGGHALGPRLYFGMYFDMPPITQVIAKAQRVLGLKPTDFAAGLKDTYNWYRRHPRSTPPDFTFEDSLLTLAVPNQANDPRIVADRGRV